MLSVWEVTALDGKNNWDKQEQTQHMNLDSHQGCRNGPSVIHCRNTPCLKSQRESHLTLLFHLMKVI